MTRKISILGSTGSIGVQTLDVAKNLKLEVLGLTANSNIKLLAKQIHEFMPRVVSVGTEALAKELKESIEGLNTTILFGEEGMNEVATLDGVDTVVTSVVGIAGLVPTMRAIKAGKNIALANKETLVTAGEIIMSEASRQGVHIIPVDSEHSAIFQCLMGNNPIGVSKLILTASGGPFRGRKIKDLQNVTLKEALNHPNWSMGSKITIDSASMMNKGLEVIEARWLFGIEPAQIQVIVHPQSIIHSMVEYVDGSVMAQLGSPDMRLPIQFALTYPQRSGNDFSRLDLLKAGKLTFEEPDLISFPCLQLAFDALKAGGTMPAAMNAANELAVSLFLGGEIKFLDISNIIAEVMDKHSVNIRPSLDDIIEVDRWARDMVMSHLGSRKN